MKQDFHRKASRQNKISKEANRITAFKSHIRDAVARIFHPITQMQAEGAK
ncbi:MAG: hypothetical protein H7Z74_10745 [Anaerolineae bacterium]|nr:hypothetical protein [Gemmatimonadaceae bacterium]